MFSWDAAAFVRLQPSRGWLRLEGCCFSASLGSFLCSLSDCSLASAPRIPDGPRDDFNGANILNSKQIKAENPGCKRGPLLA